MEPGGDDCRYDLARGCKSKSVHSIGVFSTKSVRRITSGHLSFDAHAAPIVVIREIIANEK